MYQQPNRQQRGSTGQYMMTFPDALTACFRKFVDFNGHASRAEFWWFQLLWVLWFFVSAFIPSLGLLYLVLLLPALAVGARRMHDIGRTGWWMLLTLTFLGTIVVMIFACGSSQPYVNKYGDIPCRA